MEGSEQPTQASKFTVISPAPVLEPAEPNAAYNSKAAFELGNFRSFTALTGSNAGDMGANLFPCNAGAVTSSVLKSCVPQRARLGKLSHPYCQGRRYKKSLCKTYQGMF